MYFATDAWEPPARKSAQPNREGFSNDFGFSCHFRDGCGRGRRGANCPRYGEPNVDEFVAQEFAETDAALARSSKLLSPAAVASTRLVGR
jgi:hypothetical protein